MRKLYPSLALSLLLLGGPIARSQEGGFVAPSQSSYRIGNGDVLRVSVWGQDQLTRDAVVRPDGRITLPLIPDVVAAGLTTDQVGSFLHEAFLHFVKSPLVTVSVVEAKSKIIYVTGEVLRPGAYILSSSTSALQLVMRAGGPTDFAKSSKAYVLHAAGGATPVNLKNALKGKPDSNVSLSAGDTVVVP